MRRLSFAEKFYNLIVQILLLPFSVISQCLYGSTLLFIVFIITVGIVKDTNIILGLVSIPCFITWDGLWGFLGVRVLKNKWIKAVDIFFQDSVDDWEDDYDLEDIDVDSEDIDENSNSCTHEEASEYLATKQLEMARFALQFTLVRRIISIIAAFFALFTDKYAVSPKVYDNLKYDFDNFKLYAYYDINVLKESDYSEYENTKCREKKFKKRIGIIITVLVLIIGAVATNFVYMPKMKYDKATEYMNNKEYKKALEVWESFNREYKDSAQKRIEAKSLYNIQLISLAKIGEVVVLGEYEQDNYISNGKEDIEWIVLSKEENKVLLISKHVLDNTPYNNVKKAVTWETCTARQYLNNNFYNTAFNEIIKEKIIKTTVKPADNTKYGVSGGNETVDKIFLLSLEEAKKYFKTDKERIARATKYAVSRGSFNNGTNGVWQWLRNPFSNHEAALCIYHDGRVDEDTRSGVHDTNCGVRPVMWLSI